MTSGKLMPKYTNIRAVSYDLVGHPWLGGRAMTAPENGFNKHAIEGGILTVPVA